MTIQFDEVAKYPVLLSYIYISFERQSVLLWLGAILGVINHEAQHR